MYAPDPVHLGCAIVVLFLPAWWLVAVPFWRGFRQTFWLTHPVDDAVRQAAARVEAVLEEIREAKSAPLQRIATTAAKDAERWLLRQWEKGASSPPPPEVPEAPPDAEAEGAGFFEDASVLVTRGFTVYQGWTGTLKPRLDGWEGLPPQERLRLVRDLLTWLEREDVADVVQRLGRRLGLGQAVVARKLGELRDRTLEEARGVAGAFWYTLYCSVAFQILVVEALYALRLAGTLRPALWFFAGMNLLNLARVLRDAWPFIGVYLKERRAVGEIARSFGLQAPLRKAARVLLGQATAARVLAAFMVRTGLWLDQDRVLPWVHAAVKGVAWEWPLQMIILIWRALSA